MCTIQSEVYRILSAINNKLHVFAEIIGTDHKLPTDPFHSGLHTGGHPFGEYFNRALSTQTDTDGRVNVGHLPDTMTIGVGLNAIPSGPK